MPFEYVTGFSTDSASAGNPPPSMPVAGRICVEQLSNEVRTLVPVDSRFFTRSETDDHSYAVMHESFFPRLAHTRIDHRKTGLPILRA
jgi:hypothetical protein